MLQKLQLTNTINLSIKNKVMNKTAVIIGSIVVLGVGAFFYFKPKSDKSTDGGTLGTGNLGTGNLGTGNLGTETSGGNTSLTPEQLVEDVKKIAEAKQLATKINDLKIARNKLSLQINSEIKAVGFIAYNSDLSNNMKKGSLNILNAQIKKLTEDLKSLGYTEVNGNVFKIVK